MTLPVTVTLAAVFFALTLLCGWRGARPSRPLTAPRLVPWRFLMLIAFACLVAMLAHLATLLRDPAGAGP